MPAFQIKKEMTPPCSPTNSDDSLTPPTTPNTCDAENNTEKNTSPALFPISERTTVPVCIPDLPPAPYFPMMHPYGYPQHPFSGFPYKYGPVMPYPGYGYPPAFGLPASLTNLPYPAGNFNGVSEHKENLFCPAVNLSNSKDDNVDEDILPLTRDRSIVFTSTTSRPASRTSNNDSLSPIPGRGQTTSFSSSDDTTKVSNTSLDSDKNYTATPSPDQRDLVQTKKGRTNYTPKQVRALEKVFLDNPYPDLETVEELSQDLKIPEKKLKNWFQNKRSRNKKKMQENHQLVCSSAPPYFMSQLPHMVPPFSPFYPMTSPSIMINSSTSSPSIMHRSSYPYPGPSPLTPLPRMMLPTQPYNHQPQHPALQFSSMSQQC